MNARPSSGNFDRSVSTSSASSYSSSTDSVASGSFGMDSPPVASVEVLRCLRCAKCVETTTTDDLASTGMVQIGYNIYYCSSCAKMVGYKWMHANVWRSPSFKTSVLILHYRKSQIAATQSHHHHRRRQSHPGRKRTTNCRIWSCSSGCDLISRCHDTRWSNSSPRRQCGGNFPYTIRRAPPFGGLYILGATILDCTPGATSSFERESNVLQFNSHWHCFLTGG